MRHDIKGLTCTWPAKSSGNGGSGKSRLLQEGSLRFAAAFMKLHRSGAVQQTLPRKSFSPVAGGSRSVQAASLLFGLLRLSGLIGQGRRSVPSIRSVPSVPSEDRELRYRVKQKPQGDGAGKGYWDIGDLNYGLVGGITFSRSSIKDGMWFFTTAQSLSCLISPYSWARTLR